tara:strand:+ start:626 stop:925 length:300 start_codon:yes stop_codon:yes gene_type:complete
MRFQHYYNKIYFLLKRCTKLLSTPYTDTLSCGNLSIQYAWFFIGDQLTIKANLRTTTDITIQNRDLSPVTYDYFNILEILARIRLFARSSNYSWVAPPC